MYKKVTYSAVCVSLSLVLSYIKLFEMPYGGSVTACSMLFIVLIGYWFGAKVGIIGGVACGLLQLVLGGYVVHPVQLLLDYPMAFGILGISGFFRNMKYGLYIGYLVAVLGRWFSSFISGAIFFASSAPEGMNGVIYSAIYNFSYIIPEVAITLIIISIPSFRKAIERVKNNAVSAGGNYSGFTNDRR